jgi:two-component system nitrogen regulation response regulator NtrX
MEILETYPWPGNVRELRNIMERIVIMTPQPKIDIYDLPEPVLQRTLLNQEQEEDVSLQGARDRFEREFILQKLIEYKGSVSRAAQAIRIERSNLYRKIRQLGIPYSGRENGCSE